MTKIVSVAISVCVGLPFWERHQCVVPVNCRASGTAAALAHRTGKTGKQGQHDSIIRDIILMRHNVTFLPSEVSLH